MGGRVTVLPTYFGGLMSGTSLDGVDCVIADFSATVPQVRGAAHLEFSEPLKAELLALQGPGNNELDRAARAANGLADLYADAAFAALRAADLRPEQLAALGAHGQTVRHQPSLSGAPGYTLQLNNAARLAEKTGIAVVADFRSRDVAAGGQGAPLVPAFHQAVFAHPSEHRVMLNLGGIANVTDLHPDRPVRGWDTGPANGLMDAWSQAQRAVPFDDEGRWAASGMPEEALLARFSGDTYFALPPPKSTGRDLFNLAWVHSHLHGGESAVNVQATLLALTARSVADSIRQHAGEPHQIMLCGGGARNIALVKALQAHMPKSHIMRTSSAGFDEQHVEALAFAWLARQAVLGLPGNLPAVTGAAGLRVLGAIYPA